MDFGGFFTRRFLGFFLRADPPWRPAAPFSAPANPSTPKMGVFLRPGFWVFFSAPPPRIRNWGFFRAPPCITTSVLLTRNQFLFSLPFLYKHSTKLKNFIIKKYFLKFCRFQQIFFSSLRTICSWQTTILKTFLEIILIFY